MCQWRPNHRYLKWHGLSGVIQKGFGFDWSFPDSCIPNPDTFQFLGSQPRPSPAADIKMRILGVHNVSRNKWRYIKRLKALRRGRRLYLALESLEICRNSFSQGSLFLIRQNRYSDTNCSSATAFKMLTGPLMEIMQPSIFSPMHYSILLSSRWWGAGMDW